MALIDHCIHCNIEVCCRASDVPICDKCSGKEEVRKAEVLRWNSLTTDQKLDELKERLDSLVERSYWDGLIG